MRFLRTNTAVRLTVGPFFDKTDGVTPETALTVTSCKLTLMVDDANVPTLVLDTAPTASGGANDMVHVTGDDAGFYDLELAAANVNYLGRAMLAITDAATHCPVFHEFMILPAMVYDSLVLGTDVLQADVTQLLGTAWLTPGTAGTPDVNAKLIGATSQTGRDIGASVLLSSGTGTGQLNISGGYAVINGMASNTITSAAFAAGAINAAAIAADAITDAKVASDVTIASVTGAVGSVTGLTASDVGAIKTKTDFLPSATAGAAGGVFIAGTNAATSITTALTANITGTLTTVTTATNLTTNNDKTGYGLSTAAVQAIWDALTSALTTVGSVGKKLADWTIGTAQTGDSFARLGAPAGASVSADVAAVKVDTAAVKTKTDFLPSATAGAAGGVFIAGSNAATSVTTALTANVIGNVTGNLSGSVGSLATQAKADVNAEADTALSDVGVTLARMGALTDWIDGGRLDLLLDGVVADNPNTPTRAVQLSNLMFMMVDATDLNTPETGVTVTATISKDGGAFASCTNSVTEVSGGWYKITLTNTEMTADAIAVKFTGTGCAQRNIYMRTQPT